ncbi:MAG: hypothetical protein HGB05_13330 [Chloroflexi bacterium]|nr:hypothetical protein [Chloroflexota bacterium]
MQPRGQRGVQPNVIWAESKVMAYKADMIDSKNRTLKFPDRVRLQFGLYRPEGNPPKWLKLTAPLSDQTVEIGPLPDKKIRLSYSSGTAMRASQLPHLTGKPYSNHLVDVIKEMRQTATFAKWTAFKTRLEDATVNSRLIEQEEIDEIVKDFEQLEKDGKLFLR